MVARIMASMAENRKRGGWWWCVGEQGCFPRGDGRAERRGLTGRQVRQGPPVGKGTLFSLQTHTYTHACTRVSAVFP